MTNWVKVECPLCGEMAVAETHPNLKRTWVGLTDEEVKQSYRQKCSEFGHWLDERAFLIACRWAEAKLKERNG